MLAGAGGPMIRIARIFIALLDRGGLNGCQADT
jgi:hypothetical protein